MSTTNGHATVKTVLWNKEAVKRFKRTIQSIQEANGTQFEFEGNEYDLKYAQYLLEYLEGYFK